MAQTASTVSLSILVTIEMLNAFNRSVRANARAAGCAGVPRADGPAASQVHRPGASASLSENQSLLTMPPWVNKYLIGATALSMLLHFIILYVPFLAVPARSVRHVPVGWAKALTLWASTSFTWHAQDVFAINPLTWEEWKVVLMFSFPVVLLDELLKLISRLWRTWAGIVRVGVVVGHPNAPISSRGGRAPRHAASAPEDKVKTS